MGASAFQTQQSGVGGFVAGHVRSLGFTESISIDDNIENIVDNLKRESNCAGVGIQFFQFQFTDVGVCQRTQTHTGTNQRAGFTVVHVFQGTEIDLLSDYFEVDRLPPGHAARSRRLAK